MNHFVKLDEAEVLWGYTYSDEAPDPTWVGIDFDASAAMRMPTKQRLVDGALVDTGQPVFPPDPWMVWDTTTVSWVDPRDLQGLKDAKWQEMKAARTAAEYGGFNWDGSSFDSDAASQQRIIGASQLASLMPTLEIDWTLSDNTVRTLSAQEMNEVGMALGAHVNAQYVHARTLRQQISAAQTTQELASIVW